MRVTYYGRELYHSSTPQKNHKYIDRIPIGNKFRYFYDQAELAAYKAGKALGKATQLAGKGMQVFKDGRKVGQIMEYKGDQFAKRVEGLHNIYKNSYARNPKDNAIVKARQGKSTNPIGRFGAVVSRNVRNVQKNISDTTKNIARTADRAVNEAKNFAARNFGTTKGKNANMHSNNQGYVSTKSAPKYNQGVVSKSSAPKYNQGVVSKSSAPKYNQGYVPTKSYPRSAEQYKTPSDTIKAIEDIYNTHQKNGQRGSQILDAVMYGPEYKKAQSQSKNNAPKKNQGVVNGKTSAQIAKSDWKDATDSLKNSYKPDKTNIFASIESETAKQLKDTTGKNNAPKKNQGYDSKAKQHAQNDWDEATSSLKKKNKGPNLWAGAETGGKAIASKATKEAKDAQHKKEISDSKRLKNLEKQFMRNYMADGHSSADAKRWAKKAAENYMKKHG